jgi:hypothetical protein
MVERMRSSMDASSASSSIFISRVIISSSLRVLSLGSLLVDERTLMMVSEMLCST